MISKTTRLQRQARERKLKATGGSAGEIVFMWADEWLVIRSESDLQEALRRIGLALHRIRPASAGAVPSRCRQAWSRRSQGVGASSRTGFVVLAA